MEKTDFEALVERLEKSERGKTIVRDNDQRATALFEATKQYLDRALDDIHKRVDQVERSASELRYLGVWQEGELYRPNNFISDHGSVWCCREVTKDRPPSESWTLAVKRGKDGR
jgi:hypothetical protein